MNNLPEHKKIILFDGVCNLCNGFVQFVIKNDKKDSFRFVSLQSELGKSMMSNSTYTTVTLDSVVLFDVDSKSYKNKSAAVFEIFYTLNRFKVVLQLASFLPIRCTDFLYKIIARNRYLLFGKKESCLIPTPALSSKFLL
jgi:predicted DCC family thiol-disulfide oxidoreductase YuxK